MAVCIGWMGYANAILVMIYRESWNYVITGVWVRFDLVAGFWRKFGDASTGVMRGNGSW
jgi:hypothetical protein